MRWDRCQETREGGSEERLECHSVNGEGEGRSENDGEAINGTEWKYLVSEEFGIANRQLWLKIGGTQYWNDKN